jgi:hypothetical protein
MRHAPHRRIRRTGLTVLGATVLVGSLLSGSAAAVTAVRQYVPTVAPNCATPGSTGLFTLTITNSSGSNQNLGSVVLANDPRTGFSHVAPASTPPIASGGKNWMSIRDPFFGAGLVLRATSLSNALAPGQYVSVNFSAKAPSTPGTYTWQTRAFQGTIPFLSPAFSLATGASQPTVTVGSSCSNSVSVPCPNSCSAENVQSGNSAVSVDVPACPAGHVCAGNLTVFDNGDPNLPPTPGCPDFSSTYSVTILPPTGHTASDPPIIVEITLNTESGTLPFDVCKVDAAHPDGQILPDCSFDDSSNPPPCIESRYSGGGTTDIDVEMTSTDPAMKG